MIRHRDREYWSYEKARDYVRKLGLKNSTGWRQFTKSGKLPKEIPADPFNTYKNKGWKSTGDWLGTGSIATFNRKYKTFEGARNFVHSLRLKSRHQWSDYCKSGKLPNDIPKDARGVYLKKGWKGYGDWLGTYVVATNFREYWPFEKSKAYIHNLKLKSQQEWRRYTKSGKLLKEIPADPDKVYKNKGWKGYGGWLGTGTIRPGDIEYLEFNEAKKIIREIAKIHNLKTVSDYTRAKKDGLIPSNIPATPWHVYSKKNVLRRKKN